MVVAKPTGKWVSLIFRHFYAGKMKGPVTFWAFGRLLPPWICLAMAMVTSNCGLWAWLLPASGQALATVEGGSYWHYNLVACWYTSAAIWEQLLTGAAFDFCFFLGSLTTDAFSTRPRHCRELSQLFILFLDKWIHLGIVLNIWVYFRKRDNLQLVLMGP